MDLGNILKGLIVGLGIVAISAMVMKSESEHKKKLAEETHELNQKYLEEEHLRKQGNAVAKHIRSNPTKGNLKQFKDNYPRHPFAGTAQVLLDSILSKEQEDALWLDIVNHPNELQLVEFIETFRKSDKIATARDKLKKVRFQNLESNLSAENLQRYLKQYSDESNKESLCNKLDALYWQEAKAENTEYYTSRYLHSFSENCNCNNKVEAIEHIQAIHKGAIAEADLAGKTFSGTYSRDGRVEPLLVQFSSGGKKMKGSFNLGNIRYRDLEVDLKGKQWTMTEVNGSQRITLLQGIFYEDQKVPFIETIYFPHNLYWRAELYN